jgi:hypothetical protein
VITRREEVQKARSNLSAGRHVSLVVLSEYLAHDFRWMPAAEEEPIRLRSLGTRRRWLGPETPFERGAPQGDLAPAFEHSGNRTIDDGIGETPASQFVGDFQASGAATEHELLDTPFGERGVVDDVARDERRERRHDELRADAPRREMALDLGAGTRGVREIGDGNRHGVIGAFDCFSGAFDCLSGAFDGFSGVLDCAVGAFDFPLRRLDGTPGALPGTVPDVRSGRS